MVSEPLRPDPPAPRRRSGRHLRPVERSARYRSPAVPVVVGAGIVIAALFALAAMHALLISGQIQLDDLQRDAAAESEAVRRLRLQVAELESPDRVLEVARERLGMVAPSEVGYLLPVGVEGASEGAVRVDAAEPPPPPDPEPPADAGGSPEEQEVEAQVAAGDAAEETDPGAVADGAASVDHDDMPTEGGPSAAPDALGDADQSTEETTTNGSAGDGSGE